MFILRFLFGFAIGYGIYQFSNNWLVTHKRCYEIVLRKRDGNTQRAEWLHRNHFESMHSVVRRALERADEVGMALYSVTRIDK